MVVYVVERRSEVISFLQKEAIFCKGVGRFVPGNAGVARHPHELYLFGVVDAI